jgi:pimeloyl-ACP methyl ester carboxylesterase
MFRWTGPFIVLICCSSAPAIAQTALSQNSGINSADTWVTLDLSAQTQNATMTFAIPVHNPITGAISSVVSVSPPSITYHIEAGYDTSGGLVMNLWPNGNSLVPSTTGTTVIRLAGGLVTVFDLNGNPLQVSLPTGLNSPETLLTSLLGSNPAPSLLSSLVVPNIQTHATTLNASLALSSNSTIAALGVPISTGVSAAWSYALSGSNWIANQVSIPVSTPDFTATRTIQFANVNWSQNATKDAARIAVGSTLQPLSSVTTNSLTTLPTVPADPTAAASASTISNPSCTTIAPNLGGGQNITLVHGLGDTSCAWTRMANWINQDFRINNEIIPTIGTNASISPKGSFSYIDQTGGAGTGQGEEVAYDIKNFGGNKYILVGYSQGGLVSRYAAQQLYQSNPLAVEGVVTLDSLNLGANVTSNISGGVSAIFAPFLQQMDTDNVIDGILALLLSGAAADYGSFMTSNDQSWIQDEPSSTFLANLNAQPESFKQAGIVGLTDQRWAFVRTAASEAWECDPEDGQCGERAVVNDVEIAYDVMEVIDDIASIWCFDLCSWTAPFATVTTLLDGIDSEYNNLIDFPNDTTTAGTVYAGQSDAIVQASSQFYPKSNAANYTIPHADSHVAALLSDRAHAQLYNALNAFGVQTQASCPFAVPTQYSFSSSSVASSFALTTQAGCLWSAVSQSSWIDVTPIRNGTSSGTVGFTVAPNPSNTPRWGSINVGNGNSTQAFFVYQGGPCVYTLSQGPDLAIQPTGGNGTVNVTTYMNCPWSAASNATSWLNVSVGAGGTGSGMFTWAASANTGVGDRSGTISVMGQTLTVIDGSPAGTPGTASVTFSGSPQTYTFNPCQGLPYPSNPNCPQTIYNNGTISITILNDSYTIGYGGTVTTNQLAQSLANQVNQATDSLVTATVVNGNVVNLTSSLLGTQTNYPLASSATFFAPDFSTPGFYATPSGAQLGGGTN